MRTDLGEILRSGGLGLHWRVGRLLHIGFRGQAAVLTGLCVAATLTASAADHTLILAGRNIGLLQHPAIWAFFALQFALPILMRQSLANLSDNEEKIDQIAGEDDALSKRVVHPLRRFLRLQTNSSRAVATLAYVVGFAAYVWNTYQNQLSGALPFDFWDSSHHFWGFWITRAYKLYLFCWLLPYVVLVHTGVLTVVLNTVRQARLSGRLKLRPFSADGVGGLGFIPPLVSTPVIVVLLMCSVAVAATIEVHRRFDVTPVIGLIVLFGLSFGAYVLPTLYLRSEILALKKVTLDKLWSLQEDQYVQIVDGNSADAECIARASGAIEYFEKVRRKVDSIPTYPHLRRVLNAMGIALTPSLLSFCFALYDRLSPILFHLPRRP